MLAQRGYSGSMTFDHKNETLSISVRTLPLSILFLFFLSILSYVHLCSSWWHKVSVGLKTSCNLTQNWSFTHLSLSTMFMEALVFWFPNLCNNHWAPTLVTDSKGRRTHKKNTSSRRSHGIIQVSGRLSSPVCLETQLSTNLPYWRELSWMRLLAEWSKNAATKTNWNCGALLHRCSRVRGKRLTWVTCARCLGASAPSPLFALFFPFGPSPRRLSAASMSSMFTW